MLGAELLCCPTKIVRFQSRRSEETALNQLNAVGKMSHVHVTDGEGIITWALRPVTVVIPTALTFLLNRFSERAREPSNLHMHNLTMLMLIDKFERKRSTHSPFVMVLSEARQCNLSSQSLYASLAFLVSWPLRRQNMSAPIPIAAPNKWSAFTSLAKKDSGITNLATNRARKAAPVRPSPAP